MSKIGFFQHFSFPCRAVVGRRRELFSFSPGPAFPFQHSAFSLRSPAAPKPREGGSACQRVSFSAFPPSVLSSRCPIFPSVLRPLALPLFPKPARPSTPEAETNPHQYRRPAAHRRTGGRISQTSPASVGDFFCSRIGQPRTAHPRGHAPRHHAVCVHMPRAVARLAARFRSPTQPMLDTLQPLGVCASSFHHTLVSANMPL